MISEVALYRLYLDKATHGVVQIGGENVCLTLELPWVGNQRQISCIPEGHYKLEKRYSPRFKEHLEIVGVPNRSLILFHPANNAQRELKGCIAPVGQFLKVGWGSESRKAFEKLKAVINPLFEKGEVHLIVKSADEEHSRYIENKLYETNSK